MVVCELCGSESFEKHAGFLYCSVCQTQSQHYHEEEHEFTQGNIYSRTKSSKSDVKTKDLQLHDDGFWTSWEAFNYILYGMTQEVKKIFLDDNFEITVFKLWAAYLKESKVAFTSMTNELLPKLGFAFRERDSWHLYNIKLMSCESKSTRSKKSISASSAVSNTSNSSVESQSKKRKSKMLKSYFEDSLSKSMLSESNLGDETLESLGKSSNSEISDSSSCRVSLNSIRKMFSEKDYEMYKKFCKSRKALKTKRHLYVCKNMKHTTKNKLLSIIHLALILCGSELQLSDLLRFIRESHISFAKVTHFLPFNIKFPKRDYTYIDIKTDTLMPTHLKQRQILSKLTKFLRIESIPTPDLEKLVDRYCDDLNLPDKIGNFAKTITTQWRPATLVPKKSTHSLPSYEAWAMVSIIFVMKLLFGMNGRREIYLSQVARQANSVKDREEEEMHFVFEDWQKFIECRKTVLAENHYPTYEQLTGDGYGTENSKMFLNVLMKESKDEHRSQRFIPYKRYYIPERTISSIKEMLREFTKPQSINVNEFQPSLTPQKSYLNQILDNSMGQINSKVEEILRQSFKNCDVEFAFDPKRFLNDENRLELPKMAETHDFENSNYDFTDSISNYWILPYPDNVSGTLNEFKDNVFDKTPENFQWLISECSRMLEMNIRDVYDELLYIEKKLKSGKNKKKKTF